MDSRHTCNLTYLYVYVTSFANFNLELAIVDFIFLSYFLVHLVRVNLGFMNSTFLKFAEDTRFQFAQSDLALNPSAPLVVLFPAMCLLTSSSNGSQLKGTIAYGRTIFPCNVAYPEPLLQLL